MELYLVGGAVRDKLLGLPVKDRDWVVVGATAEQLEAMGFRRLDRNFPVFKHPQTGEEYALARREIKVAAGHKGFRVHAGPDVTLEDDLRRRDLTINAMAEAENGALIDPFGGRNDLDNGFLRHVSAAFVEDPLRVLRVARFAARFGRWGFRVASFIETIHRRGYRLIAPIESSVPDEPGEYKVARFPVRERVASPEIERSPYPGLAAFTEADAEFFFGREAEVVQMWRKLTSRRLLAVIGPSGVGKSSFLRAGVIPAKPEGWGVLFFQPGEAPFAALARALVPEFAGDIDATAQLVDIRDGDRAVAMVSRWRDRYGQALLIVDQFEELFTLNPSETRAGFSAFLRRLVDDADVHVLLAMRDDFLFHAHEYSPLAPILDELNRSVPRCGSRCIVHWCSRRDASVRIRK